MEDKKMLEELQKLIHDIKDARTKDEEVKQKMQADIVALMANQERKRVPWEGADKHYYQEESRRLGGLTFKELIVTPTMDEQVKLFQQTNDHLLIMSTVLDKPVQSFKQWSVFESRISELRKALDTTTAGGVSEWIPTELSAELIDKVRLSLRVAALFKEITMPTATFEFPILTGDSTASYMSVENTAPTSTEPTSNKVTFTARKLIAYIPLSYELTEDAVFAVVDVIRDNIILALRRAIEDCTLNGDTTATHQDSNVTGARDRRKAWKGLRKWSIANSATNSYANAVPTTALLKTTSKGLGAAYGAAQPDTELCWIVGTSSMHEVLNLSDVTTMDKLGAKATILSGQIAAYMGAPIIVSEFIQENLNASGVYDGTTTDRTVLHKVHRPALWFGIKREAMLETDKNIKAQTHDLVASLRMDFEPVVLSTDKFVSTGINVAK